MLDQAEPNTRPVRIPGPDHPITIERNAQRIVITVAGHVVADTRDALTLREASYPAVQYIPRQDVDMTLLERTDHATYCPYKGDCAYFSIPAGGERSTNAVWTYEAPYAAVAAIKDHLAFYPDRIGVIAEAARRLAHLPQPYRAGGRFGGNLGILPTSHRHEPVSATSGCAPTPAAMTDQKEARS